MVFYALCYACFAQIYVFVHTNFHAIILALLYTCIKAVMLSVCHSSSKVIQAVYFILFEMANEGAGTSLDVDRAVSEAVARAMSTIRDSISSVFDTRLQVFKEARNSFSLFQTNKHILSLDTVRAIISRRNLARVLSTYRRFLTLCFPPK